MKTLKSMKAKVCLTVAAAVVLAGAGAGAALATAPGPASSGLFQTNTTGQSYGSLIEVNGQIIEPELVKAEASNGVIGYVSNSELKFAAGHPSNFRSPEEALKWQEARGSSTTSISVYDADGKTKIGELLIGANDGRIVHER